MDDLNSGELKKEIRGKSMELRLVEELLGMKSRITQSNQKLQKELEGGAPERKELIKVIQESSQDMATLKETLDDIFKDKELGNVL